MMTIARIEATQAIQFCMSTLPLCTDAMGNRVPCADNTVPLVADKPTVLRLYVGGATPGALVAGVVTRPVPSGTYGSTFTIAGVGSMTAPVFGVTRTDPSTTVQVSIRAHAAGTYRFDVVALEYSASGMVVATATSSITISFVERRRLRIRLIRIHYTGTQNNVKKDVAPRSVQDFWDATDYAQRVLPIPSPGFEIVKDSIEQYDGDFTRIDPSAHDPMWQGYAANRGTTGNLLNILDTMVGAESLAADVIYVAIYPPGVNMAAFAGWAIGRWIISDLDGITLAHELAHSNGVPQHAPCGGPANVDANFPDYPSFSSLPAASIGEVGFDWSTMQALEPLTTRDLMSYCSPKWISPYNYRKIFDHLRPLPPPPPPAPGRFDRQDRSVFVSFTQIRERWVVVDLPGFARPVPPRPPLQRTGYEVIARDPSGAIISRCPAVSPTHDTSVDCVGELLEAEVPWHEEIAVVELVRDHHVLVRREVGPAPMLKVEFPPAADLAARRGRIAYRADSSASDVAVAVRFTSDGGATWTATVARVADGTVAVDLLVDRSGSECRLEVLASAGWRTAVASSEVFSVPPREEPILAWASLLPSATGDRLALFAIVKNGAARSSGISWTSDLQGDLGQGARIAPVLRPGRHRIDVRSDEPFVQPACLDVEIGRMSRETAANPLNS